MANKSNLSTILGVAGATILAAGGSAFVTDTTLNVVTNQANVQETETVIPERETEEPIKVETFTSTKDSFTVRPVSNTENKRNSDSRNTGNGSSSSDAASENTGVGNSDSNGSGSAGNGTYTEENGSGSGGSSDSSNSSGSASNSGGSSSNSSGSGAITYTGNGGDVAYYDEWGGWMSTNGDYYDGQGGYYDGNGYHYVGDSIKTPQGAANYTPSSGNGGSSGSGGSSGGWDDSYFSYDTSVRYLDASEINSWSAYELAVARNEIFARHGRIFVTPEWSSYFAQKSWYTPKYDNVDSLLNDYEWANLELILKREEKFY